MKLWGNICNGAEKLVLVEPSRPCQAWLDDRRSETGSGVGFICSEELMVTHSNQRKWFILVHGILLEI